MVVLRAELSVDWWADEMAAWLVSRLVVRWVARMVDLKVVQLVLTMVDGKAAT